MKKIITASIIASILITVSCSTGKNKKAEIYEYNEAEVSLSGELNEKIGEWAEEGTICYGLVVLIDEKGIAQEGSPVKARILRIKSDSIRMKSLETINLSGVEGCGNMGINSGDKWWESEGDLFQTREEAEKHLTGILTE